MEEEEEGDEEKDGMTIATPTHLFFHFSPARVPSHSLVLTPSFTNDELPAFGPGVLAACQRRGRCVSEPG